MKATQNLGHHLRSSLMSCVLYSWGIGFAVSLALMSLVFISTNAEAEINDDIALDKVHSLSDLQSGQLVFRTEHGHYLASPKLNTEVDIEVNGLLARVTVSQTFTNPSSQWQEGIYVFPLPETAAVDHLRMKVGDRIIEGDIKPKKQAHEIYQQAKQEGKQASLIEQQRPNMFTTSVANIAPNDSITVVIEYQQMVSQDANEFSLRFPTAITPRYIPGNPIANTQEISQFNGSGWAVNTDQLRDASHITPPVLSLDSEVANQINISILLSAGFDLGQVNSPYHQVEEVTVNDSTRKIRLVDDVPANRDFELVWLANHNQAPQAALFKQRKNGEDYAMLMLTPPNKLNVETISRELVFIIDTSGSMDGTSMKQAKTALQYGLTQLRPQDSFNIIRFSDDVDSLFRQAKVASRNNLESAHDYVNWLRADGGTEMAPALKVALQAKQVTKGIRQVVFLTDGSVGNEDELFSIIEQDLGNSRLFTVGIGSAPNSHFMHRAALFGRGSHSYIGSEDEVRQKMQTLFNKLSHPVLTDIKLEFDDSVVEVWPKTVPDLYLGEPLILTLKAKTLPDEIVLSGVYGKQIWQQKVALQGGGQSEAVSVLWARRKISGLMDDYRRAGEDNELIKDDIVDIALTHHLVTKFTSLVAVDKTPVRPVSEKLNTQAIAMNPPAGSVMTQFPQTATPARLQLFLGFILLLASLFLRWRQA
ncbi:MAG: marine proteobacterial sortase target protein [Methylophaga sp.]|nr:marine proteobacterial sortase target protein [Methylophaga sp.]